MTETIRLGKHTTILCGAEKGKYPSGNPLLVEGPEARLVIDSALGVPIPDVDLVLLSHFHEDHTWKLGTHPDLEVRIHAADLTAVSDIDAFFSEGGYVEEDFKRELIERFEHATVSQAAAFDLAPVDLGGDVRVTPVHLPGHTAGHCGFLVEPDGILFTADIDLSSFGPFYGDNHSSLSDMRESLRRAGEIDAAAYATFHHKREVRSTGDYRAMLAAFTDVLDRRRDRVLALLDEPRTAADLVGKGVVYRPGNVPSYAASSELRMTQLHLDELAGAGEVIEEDGVYRRS